MDANISAKYVSCGAACVDSGLRQVESKNMRMSHRHTHTDTYVFSVKKLSCGFVTQKSSNNGQVEIYLELYRFIYRLQRFIDLFYIYL